jgi:hypothetical protein
MPTSPDLDDSFDAWWNPGALDDRFTEDQRHFQLIHEKIKLAQLSPQVLAALPDSDLVYIAGHLHTPWEVDPSSQEAGDRATKLKQNGERARVELQRRHAHQLARTVFWRQLLTALVAAVTGSVLTLAIREIGDDDGQPSAPAVTVPATQPPATTAP